MQRKSRFMRSTASDSSNSNVTIRKGSGTSSVGGDSLAADRESGSLDYDSKTKACPAKCNMRLLSSNLKNLRKPVKSGRVQRPNFRSLQNTVVLAPFHSLKKCFQNKLMDLYSFEKMKNINHKTQMAKNKNMFFKYDIIELNSSRPIVKKEGKAVKKMKQKSKCANYCQCKKTGSKAEEKMSLKNSKQGRKTSTRRQTPRHSEYLKTKKRKLSREVISPVMMKTELTPVLGGYQSNDQLIFSQVNSSPSAKSSRSKYDSWETYSNSPTCKEEHMKGSLAISTTSFDSYLEHFDKRSWDHSDTSRRFGKRGKCQKAAEGVDTMSIPPKPNASSSRHILMHVEMKNNDRQIGDFIGKQPQTQLIPSLESNQHLQLLQRQNKAKAKKPENESVAGYYLRSLSLSKEKIIENENQELHEQRSAQNTFKHKALQIEVAIQVEENALEREGSSTSFLKKSQEPTSSACGTSFNISSNTVLEKPSLSSTQKAESSPRTLPCESSHLLRTDPFESLESQVEDTKSQKSEGGLSLIGEHSDRPSMELIDGLSEQLQGPTNSQQSQGSGIQSKSEIAITQRSLESLESQVEDTKSQKSTDNEED